MLFRWCLLFSGKKWFSYSVMLLGEFLLLWCRLRMRVLLLFMRFMVVV